MKALRYRLMPSGTVIPLSLFSRVRLKMVLQRLSRSTWLHNVKDGVTIIEQHDPRGNTFPDGYEILLY